VAGVSEDGEDANGGFADVFGGRGGGGAGAAVVFVLEEGLFFVW